MVKYNRFVIKADYTLRTRFASLNRAQVHLEDNL